MRGGGTQYLCMSNTVEDNKWDSNTRTSYSWVSEPITIVELCIGQDTVLTQEEGHLFKNIIAFSQTIDDRRQWGAGMLMSVLVCTSRAAPIVFRVALLPAPQLVEHSSAVKVWR